MTTAQAATTVTKAELLCSAGTTNIVYCAYYCPSGTLVAEYCEPASSTSTTGTTTTTTSTVSSTSVLPQGPPTLFSGILWGAKLKLSYEGPSLKFHVRSGINGAPFLKTLTLTLPSGLSFAPKQKRTLAVNGPELQLGTKSVTFNFRNVEGSVLVYLKNHAMIESPKLRKELAKGVIKALTFHIIVTDGAGLRTALTLSVPPES